MKLTIKLDYLRKFPPNTRFFIAFISHNVKVFLNEGAILRLDKLNECKYNDNVISDGYSGVILPIINRIFVLNISVIPCRLPDPVG